MQRALSSRSHTHTLSGSTTTTTTTMSSPPPPPPPPPPPLKLNLFCAICQDDGDSPDSADDDDLPPLFFMLDTCTHSYHETCLRQMVSEKRKETGVYDSAFCPVCKLPMDSDDCDYLSHAYRDLHIRTAYVPSRKDARLRITIEEVFDDDSNSPLLLEVSRKRVVHTIYNPMSVLPRIRTDESAKRRNKRARKERRDRYSRYRRQQQRQQHRLELPEEEELDMQAGELSDTELEIIVL